MRPIKWFQSTKFSRRFLKAMVLNCGFIIVVLLGAETSSGNEPYQRLKGSWYARTAQGMSSIVFQSSSSLIYNGKQIPYALMPGVIRLNINGQSFDFSYMVDEKKLCVTDPDGYSLCYGRINDDAGRTSPDSMPKSSSQLSDLLLSSAWCAFSYKGSSSGGNSRYSKVQFYADGTYTLRSKFEGSSKGYSGNYSSFDSQGKDGRWQVYNNQLYMSEGPGQLELVNLRVKFNSNGSPILVAEGKEYCRCQ